MNPQFISIAFPVLVIALLAALIWAIAFENRNQSSRRRTLRRRASVPTHRRFLLTTVEWLWVLVAVASVWIYRVDPHLTYWFLLFCSCISALAQTPQRTQQPISSPKVNQLKSDLYAMVNGDYDLADRLIHNCKLSNPGRDEVWVIEKVIYDFQRDRR